MVYLLNLGMADRDILLNSHKIIGYIVWQIGLPTAFDIPISANKPLIQGLSYCWTFCASPISFPRSDLASDCVLTKHLKTSELTSQRTLSSRRRVHAAVIFWSSPFYLLSRLALVTFLSVVVIG